ncbi:TonB-dependent receptor [Peristeroidobacter soli]|uniref:TonB-dependent receptor n=1 Tax=Peristeroidobacter soli TaxID=2497877 RepID=UPI00101BD61E|nr:TonB-dependent receptor [Peristeroidobacter soli]
MDIRRIVVGVVALALTSMSAIAGAQNAITVSIPSGDLAAALEAFAKQAGIELVFRADQLKGIHTEGISGTLTPREAVERLLRGTAFVAQSDAATGAMLITPVERTTSNGRSANEPVEEIIVTATKRAESIQDVPLSITAIGNADIESRGLKGMGDYLAAVPGASFIETNSVSSAIVIRGIETAAQYQNFGSGTTVASYFGETPITNSAGILGGSGVDLKLVDIERVEVLRGPQGTSFGNSSLGGAVRTIPVAPKLDRFGGKAAASYSVTGKSGGGNQMWQGVLNAPLVADKLAVRAVAYEYDNSGYYKNVSGSDPAMQAYVASLGPRAVSLATNADDRGQDRTRGARVALLWQATDDLKLSLSYLYQKIEQDGFTSSQGLDNGYGYVALRIFPSHALRGSVDSIYDNRIGIANSTLEYNFGWAALVTAASWVDSKTQYTEGGNIDAPYDGAYRSPHTAFSGEMRLASKLDGPWQFLAGLFHEKQNDVAHERNSSLEVPALNPWGDGINEVLGIFDTTRELTQDSVFGELSYDLRSNLTLTLGARAYRFDRSNQLVSSGWFTGVPLDAPDVARSSISKSGNTYKANLSYKPTDKALVYASFSQGFRLGRPATGLIPGICDTDNDGVVDGSNVTIAATRVIDSDTLDNFELGGKFTLLDGRLAVDASVYRANWQGLPTNARATCRDLGYFYVANAGEATSQGVEIQTSYRLARGLKVDLGGSYTNAELSVDVPTLDAVAGDRLPGSPRVNASLGIQYDTDIAGRAVFARADGAYRGTFFGNLAQTPLTEAGGYVTANVRAGVTISSVNLELFVNNLTDASDYVWRGTGNTDRGYGYRLRPRTLGLQMSYNF